MLKIWRLYYYFYQYFQSLLKTATEGGVKEICCFCWLYFSCSSKGRGPLLPVPKQGLFKRCLSLLQLWGAPPAGQGTADGRQAAATRQQMGRSVGRQPWDISSQPGQGEQHGVISKSTKQHKGFVSLLTTSHLSHLLAFVNGSFIKYFEGMASPSSSLLCGIKLTKHNSNTAHVSSTFLEL